MPKKATIHFQIRPADMIKRDDRKHQPTLRQPGLSGSIYRMSTGAMPQMAITAGSWPFATTPS